MTKNLIRSHLWQCLMFAAWLTGCGIATYPGQPGVKTNGHSRLDLEVLDEDGLWTYETSYDNSLTGEGVESITTRLYPNVYTYSSNARSNGHGTYYRHKLPYRGSKIQMISFPQQGQIYLPEDSRVIITIDFETSMDEVDDRNLSEEGLFVRNQDDFTKQALAAVSWRWNLLKSARLSPMGTLSYEIEKLELSGKEYVFGENLIVHSNIVQSGINLSISQKEKLEFRDWLEAEFPSGFSGEIIAWVNGGQKISRRVSLNTLNTLSKNGAKIIRTKNIESIIKQSNQ